MRYQNDPSSRDLRIDFLRGFIMIMVITIHMEYFSLFNALFWGRLGFVSSAEGFVALSGMVVGIVYTKKCKKQGVWPASQGILRRAVQLYVVNICMILAIALCVKAPFLDAFSVTHWVNPGSGQAFPTYSSLDGNWLDIAREAVFLTAGPHQFQVIGLYVFLLLLAPLALWLIHTNKALVLLAICWAFYFINTKYQINLTGAQFETAFPLLTWQALFYSSMVIGAHMETLGRAIVGKAKKVVIALSLAICTVFLLMSLSSPHPMYWPWFKLSLVDPANFSTMHAQWFSKNALGVGRVVNNIALYIVNFAVLTYYWQPINKALGWLLVPIGQASLYVFVVHVFLVMLVANGLPHNTGYFWPNTVLQVAVILLIWLMVKYRVLYSVIPR